MMTIFNSINKTFLFFIIINIFTFPFIKCGISIAQPEQLAHKFFNSEIEAVYGEFGQIDLGFETVGSVWIMPRKENSKEELSPNYACNSLSNIKIIRDKYNFANFNVVLVDRGTCSFPKMAREVQRIGGDMILIINNKPGSISGQRVIDEDGTGRKITIPVAMISYNDGKAIMDYIINHPKENVYLNIEIGLNQRKKVKLDIFTNILNTKTFQFLSEFKSYFYLLEKYIDMNIYYLTPQLEGILQSQKKKDCLKDGLFCQTNTNININQKITGIDLIYESLYHQCLFQRAKKSYFNIISQYEDMCMNAEKYSNFCGLHLFNEDMREIIMDCVFNSFGNSDYKKIWEKPQEIKAKLDSVNSNINTILVENRLQEKEHNINSYPEIYINDIKYNLRLSSMYVFDSVCQAFFPMPEPCLKYIIRPTKIKREGILWYDVVFIIMGIIILNVIFYFLIKNGAFAYLNDRLNLNTNILTGQINNVISSYFNLREMTNKNSDEDDDEEAKKKINNLGDIQTFIEEEDKNGEKDIGTKLIISNDIPSNKKEDDKKENNKKEKNNIDNKKEDDDAKEEEEEDEEK